MFRNRRNCSDAITFTAMAPSQGQIWLAAIRSVVFNVLLFGGLSLLMIVHAPALLFNKVPSYLFTATGRYTLWLVKVICGLRYQVQGAEYIPAGSCIFASKHQSAWDTAVFLVLIPEISYVLKKELTKIPIYGKFLERYGMISIDRNRGRKALLDLKTQAKELLDKNRKIVIFPEGSRTAIGSKGDYQKGILILYKEFDCPIVPVALNSGLKWGKRRIKWPGVITIQFLPSMPKNLENEAFMYELEERIESVSLELLKKPESN
jgi:1-acyl-sn-glycerol-3-phosphate acyltransferase